MYISKSSKYKRVKKGKLYTQLTLSYQHKALLLTEAFQNKKQQRTILYHYAETQHMQRRQDQLIFPTQRF